MKKLALCLTFEIILYDMERKLQSQPNLVGVSDHLFQVAAKRWHWASEDSLCTVIGITQPHPEQSTFSTALYLPWLRQICSETLLEPFLKEVAWFRLLRPFRNKVSGNISIKHLRIWISNASKRKLSLSKNICWCFIIKNVVGTPHSLRFLIIVQSIWQSISVQIEKGLK